MKAFSDTLIPFSAFHLNELSSFHYPYFRIGWGNRVLDGREWEWRVTRLMPLQLIQISKQFVEVKRIYIHPNECVFILEISITPFSFNWIHWANCSSIHFTIRTTVSLLPFPIYAKIKSFILHILLPLFYINIISSTQLMLNEFHYSIVNEWKRSWIISPFSFSTRWLMVVGFFSSPLLCHCVGNVFFFFQLAKIIGCHKLSEIRSELKSLTISCAFVKFYWIIRK